MIGQRCAPLLVLEEDPMGLKCRMISIHFKEVGQYNRNRKSIATVVTSIGVHTAVQSLGLVFVVLISHTFVVTLAFLCHKRAWNLPRHVPKVCNERHGWKQEWIYRFLWQWLLVWIDHHGSFKATVSRLIASNDRRLYSFKKCGTTS